MTEIPLSRKTIIENVTAERWEEVVSPHRQAFLDAAESLKDQGFANVQVIEGLTDGVGVRTLRVLWGQNETMMSAIYGSISESHVELMHTAGFEGWDKSPHPEREDTPLKSRLKGRIQVAKPTAMQYLRGGVGIDPIIEEARIYPAEDEHVHEVIEFPSHGTVYEITDIAAQGHR